MKKPKMEWISFDQLDYIGAQWAGENGVDLSDNAYVPTG